MPTIAGIDLAAGRGVTELAVLVVAGEGRHPVFNPSSHRPVATDTDIVAVVASTSPAVIAIDAPLTLPRAVMRGLASGSPSPDAQKPAREQEPDTRMAHLDGGSAYTRAAERDPIWSTLGIRPLPVSFLGGLTFRAISLLPLLRAAAPEAAIIEVFPSATLRWLGMARPAQTARATQRRGASKTAETYRRSAQLILQKHIAGVSAPDDQLYGADLLDALAAALTGVRYLNGNYVAVGDDAEGIIVLLA